MTAPLVCESGRAGLLIEMTEEEFLYELLGRLGVNVSELRKMNPTENQLEGLYMGLNRNGQVEDGSGLEPAQMRL